MDEVKKCYIYTRVSTEMQVEGYSLDAQKDKLVKFADLNGYDVVGFYSDEGRSGKNTKDRPEFLRMIADVQGYKDNVDFILVYKLSRFGRKASDILTNLETLQMCSCELICVEDGINTSLGTGKLMISILAAFAEIERENIRSQSLSGREEKARQGLWNGGVPPYGYTVKDGILEIVEEEAVAVRKVFELYTTSSMGTVKIAEYLNDHGYKKFSKRKNDARELSYFTAHLISLILDNPTYTGKLSYGRTRTEKIKGTRDDSHRVKANEFILVEGQHKAIIAEEIFYKAREKKQYYIERSQKSYNTNHINLLSGLIKCPICGKGMYGNVSRKKKPDGSIYKDIYYYYCKHGKMNVLLQGI
jgi:site-specific DNA recombinase